MAAPTVGSISPAAGTPAGGTRVLVNGTNLTSPTAVKVGGVNVTSFVGISATQLVCILPSGSGTQDITVTTAGGTSSTSAADQFTFVMPKPNDPSATSATVALFNLLYDLTFLQPGFYSGGTNSTTNMHLTCQILSGEDVNEGSNPYNEWNQWPLTTGKTPAMMVAAIDYTNLVQLPSSYNAQGIATIGLSKIVTPLLAHALRGGIVGVMNCLRNNPCQYTANGALTGGATTVAAINAAGQLSINGITGSFYVGGGNFKILTAAGTLLQGSYTSASGSTTVTLSGVVLSGSGSINAAATVYLSQTVLAFGNNFTTLQNNEALCLQYGANAYQNLAGAGANTLAGCSWTGGAASVTVTTTNTVQTMPVTIGMFVTGTGIPAGATVTAILSKTQFILTASTNFTTESNQTLTFQLGQSTSYASQLALDANNNLNAMLDQIVAVFQEFAGYGVSVIFRHLEEGSLGNTCWDWGGNLQFWEYVYAYCYGYITGNAVFSGQPVSATPCHNVLFVHCPLFSTATNMEAHPPIVGGVCYADIIGIDQYANPPSGFATAMGDLHTIAQFVNLPRGFCEVFGGNNGTLSNIFPTGYLDDGTYGSTPIDLSTLGGGSLVLTAPSTNVVVTEPFATGSFSGTATATAAGTLTDGSASWTTNQFAGYRVTAGTSTAIVASNTATVLTLTAAGWTGGTPASTSAFTILPFVLVPTTQGLKAVTYSSVTNSGAAPCTMSGLGVSGVPAGSLIVTKGCVAQPVALTADNCGNATFLTEVKSSNAWFMPWWGGLNQIYADVTTVSNINGDGTMINLENISGFFAAPWVGMPDLQAGHRTRSPRVRFVRGRATSTFPPYLAPPSVTLHRTQRPFGWRRGRVNEVKPPSYGTPPSVVPQRRRPPRGRPRRGIVQVPEHTPAPPVAALQHRPRWPWAARRRGMAVVPEHNAAPPPAVLRRQTRARLLVRGNAVEIVEVPLSPPIVRSTFSPQPARMRRPFAWLHRRLSPILPFGQAVAPVLEPVYVAQSRSLDATAQARPLTYVAQGRDLDAVAQPVNSAR